MRHINALRAVTALCMLMLSISACQPDGPMSIRGPRKIGIQVQGNDFTKAGMAASDEQLIYSIPLESEGNEKLVLSVYLSDLDEGNPETKGTPIYTSNIGTVSGYESFSTSVWKDGASYTDPAGQSMASVSATYDSTEEEWDFAGGPYYWPEDGSDITFCSKAPVSVNGAISDLSWDLTTKTASFSYAQPAADTEEPYMDASKQQDILLAIDTWNKNSNVRSKESYAKIHFYHALTAVRFTRGKELNDCKILDVVMENFLSSGDAVFDPSLEPYYTWANQDNKTTFRQTFNSEIGSSVERADDTAVPPTSGGSLDPTVRDTDPNNDGQYTFMMVPQELPSDAKILIYVEGRIHPIEMAIGSLPTDTGDTVTDTNNSRMKDWTGYAGKVITFRVESEKMDMVRVAVDDKVTGQVKSNVQTANTGRNGVYMRVALIANCLNKDGAIVNPCKIGDSEHLGNIKYEGDGTFVLPSEWDNYWYFNETDGFYYYKYVVPSQFRTSIDLFTSFTVKPGLIVGTGEGANVYGVKFDIVVQGIDAGPAGSYTKDGVTNAHWQANVIDLLSTTADGIALTADGIAL